MFTPEQKQMIEYAKALKEYCGKVVEDDGEECKECIFAEDGLCTLFARVPYFWDIPLIETKLTDKEKKILRNIYDFYNCFKYIARDKNGQLFAYSIEPFKVSNSWLVPYGGLIRRLYSEEHMFKFIKWEDEEPYLIEDLLKEE